MEAVAMPKVKSKAGSKSKVKAKPKTRRALLKKDAKAGKMKHGKAYLELDADLEIEKASWKKANPADTFSWGKLLKSKKEKRK